MQVIGAGLPRTATSTQLLALEQLGFTDCYHMRNVFADLDGELTKWERVVAGKDDWDSILGDFESCCDFPTARFYRELADFYPDAKVVLTVRDAEGWVRSMRETIWPVYYGDSLMRHVNAARALVNPDWQRFIDLMQPILFAPDGAIAGADIAGDTEFAAIMERWNERVRATIAPHRLLVWEPGDGWDPLCEFLEVQVPDGPVPRVNDTAAFKEGIVGGALADLADWWEQRERPASGLHGVAAR
jgi:hypothetical protein